MIRTVIFDFDGTIADTAGGIIRTMQRTLELMGLPMKDEASIRHTIGLPLVRSVSLIGVPDDRIDEGTRIYREQFDIIALPNIHLFNGVLETLDILRGKGISLAIATSRSSRSLEAILAAEGIRDRFLELGTVNGNYKPKPAPDMCLYLLDRMNAKASETLVVGDTVFDLEMGRNAGCLTCGVTYGNHDRATLLTVRPDYLVDDFREITQIAGIREND